MADVEAIRLTLKDLCEDQNLVNGAKIALRRTINNGLTNNQTERTTLLNKFAPDADEAGEFNLADLYFLNGLISDLFVDAQNIDRRLGDTINGSEPRIARLPL